MQYIQRVQMLPDGDTLLLTVVPSGDRRIAGRMRKSSRCRSSRRSVKS